PLIRRLVTALGDRPVGTDAPGDGPDLIADAAWLLLDQARILEGEPVPDPAAFARRLSLLVERGLGTAALTT
ncbi:MAG: hypothetical protein D6826_04730, partial [Alphaproteobacteria bacterium]